MIEDELVRGTGEVADPFDAGRKCGAASTRAKAPWLTLAGPAIYDHRAN